MTKKKDEEIKVEEPPKIEQPDMTEAANMAVALNEASERLERANLNLEANVKRQQEIMLENTLGGQATVQHAKPISAEERANREAKKALEGTGYADELFPDVD